jgi:hypothetical protein
MGPLTRAGASKSSRTTSTGSQWRWNKALHGRMRGTLKKHRIKNLSMDRLLSSRALVVCLFSKPLYVSKTLQLVSTGISVKEFLEKT